ncbi:MAG TPA: ribosome maturation factor RimM [Pantanalinema sp.]
MSETAERYISVGRILKPHGVRGEVKVDPMTDDPARFKKLGRIFCLRPSGERVTLHIEAARLAGAETVLVKFREYATPEAVDALRDSLIQIPRSEAPPLPKGKVYYADVIGMAARVQETGEVLGTITAIISGGNELLEIARPDGKELLIPWVDAFVSKVDAEAREVWITPVPGLLES